MATLPEVPRGLELEDYVAALFQSTKHYVERNVCEPDVLELDIVATSFGADALDTQLIEVKSGQWGFGDLFKTLGRMRYLSLPKGLFISTRASGDKPIEFYAERVGSMGLHVMVIDDLSSVGEVFASAGYGVVDDMSHALWRYSFWTERRLIEDLRAEGRARPEANGPREVLRYFRLVNDEVFLTADPRLRAAKLYEAFAAHPLLSLGVAREIDGAAFDVQTPGESRSLRSAFLTGAHPLLQVSMYVEHRARLALLKSVIDCLCAGITFEARRLLVSGLPQTFIDAVRELRGRPQFARYALFWQILLWGWGGLILDDHSDAELQALAAQSGLDPNNVQDALDAYDLLFPTGSGWVRRMRTADYRFVAMVPWPFMGIGAFHRLLVHGVGDFRNLNLGGQYTARDLAARLQVLIRLLDGPATP